MDDDVYSIGEQPMPEHTNVTAEQVRDWAEWTDERAHILETGLRKTYSPEADAKRLRDIAAYIRSTIPRE
jgi:hypothetical protein